MTKNKLASALAYNTWGTLIYYFCQWLPSVLVVRFSGYSDAGVLSLAITFSTSYSCACKFGMRSYQVCDVEEKYSNGQYTASRLVTIGVFFPLFLIFLLLSDYSRNTVICCILYMIMRSLESFSDVIFGVMQRQDRYDQIAVSSTIKGIFPLLCFTVILACTHELLYSVLLLDAVYFILVWAYDWRCMKKSKAIALSKQGLSELLWQCFPLMLNSALNAVLLFLPQNAIEHILGTEILGYYGSIAIVVVAFSTLASAIWGAVFPYASRLIQQRDLKKLYRFLLLITGAVLLVTVIALLAGTFLGRPVLTLLFGTKILNYIYLLNPLLISAVLFMVMSFFDGFFIPFGGRSVLLVTSIICTLVCGLSVRSLILHFGLLGAVYSMLAGMIVRIVILIGFTFAYLRKLKTLDRE